ncbi:MAG: hypothetical protein ABJF11_02690 [Reichenbachiella sp.]|uniref:hypothetical protein n=1 Tax=Reichenbachiella sp. TaxID=2184521 RepID=UPI0032630106
MKDLLNILKYSLFLSLIVTMASCGGDDNGGGDDTDPLIDIAANLTAGEATFSSVSKPDGASDFTWDGMILEFTGGVDGGTYTVTGSPNEDVWPAAGDWEFKDGTDGKFIVRDGTTDVAISVGSTELVTTFTVDDGSGRVKVVNGEWEFSFAF